MIARRAPFRRPRRLGPCRTVRIVSAALVWLAPGGVVAHAQPARSPQDTSRLVTFSATTPLASNLGLASRLLTPFAAAAIPKRLAALGKQLREQPIDIGEETFRLSAPAAAPADGYGVLVFVPPWDDNHLPAGWIAAAKVAGVILVSPTHAGNDASPLARREPLAILAAVDVGKLYPVNPRRIYVAGFSGGAKVALRLALAYPDLFRGAFLDAGAEAVGARDFPLPSTALFQQLRAGSRLAFFAGGDDRAALPEIDEAVSSLRRLCVTGLATRTEPGMGHEIAPAAALSWALTVLDGPRAGPEADQTCWSKLQASVRADLDRARAALAKGDQRSARVLLKRINQRFGGLAAPESLQLMESLAAASGGGASR